MRHAKSYYAGILIASQISSNVWGHIWKGITKTKFILKTHTIGADSYHLEIKKDYIIMKGNLLEKAFPLHSGNVGYSLRVVALLFRYS